MSVIDTIEDKIAEEIEEQRQKLMAEITELESELDDLQLQIAALEEELELVEALQQSTEGIHTYGQGSDTSLEVVREYNSCQDGAHECHTEQYSFMKVLCDTGVYEAKCAELNLKLLGLKGKQEMKEAALAALRTALAIL